MLSQFVVSQFVSKSNQVLSKSIADNFAENADFEQLLHIIVPIVNSG